MWKHVDVADKGSQLLPDAIILHQDNADHCQRRLPQPTPDLPAPLDSEAEVASAFKSHVADYLTRLAKQQLDMQAEWRQEAPTSIMQGAILQAAAASGCSAQARSPHVPLSCTTAPSFSQRGRQQQPKWPPLTGAPSSSSSIDCKRLKTDLVLRCSVAASAAPDVQHTSSSMAGEAAGGAASSSTAATDAGPVMAVCEQRCACVGEMKVAAKLMTGDSGALLPIDLQEAWCNEAHDFHKHAKAAIRQLYTYMQVLGVSYGFISCWHATWLAFCPSANRRVLYLSGPLLAASQHCTVSPAATTMGALSWLQQQALSSPTVAAPPAPLLSDLGASTDSGDGSGDSGLDDGAKLGSQEEYDPTADRHRWQASKTTKSSGKGMKRSIGQQLASYSLPPACLQLSDNRVCCGSAGEVVLGTCRGAAAVVKLLGPDNIGLAAFAQEWQMYAELHSVQGQLVPSLLAVGHLWAGVHFIATSRIDGVPLSSLTCIPEVVAVAAVKSLKTLYTAFPGFVHGDVRLANVLLVSESSDAAPRCMWVDLARSRLDGTQKQREAELRKLKKLLGM